MENIILTSSQEAAVEAIVAQLVAGQPLVILKGLAGTGKTSVIPAICHALSLHDIETVVGAPTHRAVMILRKKGLSTAETVHALATMTYYTADYARAVRWLGEEVNVHLDAEPPHADVEGLPWLVYEAVKPDVQQAHNVARQRNYSAKRRLQSLGIDGKDYMTKPGPRDGRGVLIIDEASMVGKEFLAICQEAFPQVLLIGDPGQLAPVKDEMILDTMDGILLTEIHRQAAESPIIQLAYKAREGQPFAQSELTAWALQHGESIQVCSQLAAQALRHAPLIVWRNEVRTTCTKAIRHALGYPADGLVLGEPLVCRSTSREDRALGFYNNGLHTIVELFVEHPRKATVQDDLGNTETVTLHLEELDGGKPPPQSIPFRFAYCFTAHTSQGGEWPLVHISLPEVWLYHRSARKPGAIDERKRWGYTASTRAKETLCFLTQHEFLTSDGRVIMPGTKKDETPVEKSGVKPPSAPLLGQSPREDTPDPLQLAAPAPASPPLTAAEQAIFGNDIPDVAVPEPLIAALATRETSLPDHPAVPSAVGLSSTPHEALLPLMQGFCAVLQKKIDVATSDHYRELTRQFTQAWEMTEHGLTALRDKNDHVLYQVANVLATYQEQGFPVRPGQSAEVRFYSPNGYPITMHLTQPTQEALLGELKTLTDWLASKGCKPGNE